MQPSPDAFVESPAFIITDIFMGRFLLIILVLVILAAIAAVATGYVNLHGSPGTAPKISIEGGKAPSINADVGSIDLGTKNSTVEVPTVGTTEKKVSTPTVTVKKPGE